MEKARLLLVDDDPDLVEAMRIVLEGAGYECIQAGNGKQAIDLLRREKPDLMILDVMMDDMTEGFHVAYKIRRPDPGLEEFAKMPILMLTAVTQRTGMRFDRMKDGDFLPVEDFLEKPVQPAVLLEKVRTLLARAAV